MKKMLILGMAVLILSLAFVGCGDGDGGDKKSGSTTVTVDGLGDHNNKYFYGTNGSTIHLVSANGKAAKISEDSVSLSVKTTTGADYKGSDTVSFAVFILNTANIQTAMQGGGSPDGSVSVAFTNGKGTGTFLAAD